MNVRLPGHASDGPVRGERKMQPDIRPSDIGFQKRPIGSEFREYDHAARRGKPSVFEEFADAAAHAGRIPIIVRTKDNSLFSHSKIREPNGRDRALWKSHQVGRPTMAQTGT